MNREEYLKSKEQPVAKSDVITTRNQRGYVCLPPENLEEYLKIRESIEDFDSNTYIDKFLTAEDFEAFDRNFEKIMDSLQFKDESVTEDEIEVAIKMMKAHNWKWGDHIPSYQEFVNNIKYCYEQALKSGHPRTGCGTGGVNVEIDIFDHSVKVTFGNIDAFAYDGEGYAI